MFLEQSTPSISHHSVVPKAAPSASAGWLVFTIIISVLAGGVGGAAAVLWGGSWLQQFPSTTMMFNRLGGSGNQRLSVQEESATTEVVKQVSPSVVSIIISKDLSKISNQTGPNPFPFNNIFDPSFPFNFFFGGQQPTQPQPPATPKGKQEIGGGTGFVVDTAKGLILTNRHVVADTEASYTVLTNDGRRLDALVVARDTVNDLALVQVKDTSLPALTFGNSDGVTLGQTVIAIGNALGEYRNTITKGVISGIGRNVVAGDNQGSSESLEGVFQTDAAINPGNSGGPLVALSGQVIGINTAVSQQGQLIGFAIPANEAKRTLASYQKNGRIVRPYLGIRYVLVTPEVSRANKLDVTYGALITRGQTQSDLGVVSGSPADKAGLVENDIILEVEGQPVDTEHSLVNLLARFVPGDTVRLKVYHKGVTKQVSVKLEEFKETK